MQIFHLFLFFTPWKFLKWDFLFALLCVRGAKSFFLLCYISQGSSGIYTYTHSHKPGRKIFINEKLFPQQQKQQQEITTSAAPTVTALSKVWNMGALRTHSSSDVVLKCSQKKQKNLQAIFFVLKLHSSDIIRVEIV